MRSGSLRRWVAHVLAPTLAAGALVAVSGPATPANALLSGSTACSSTMTAQNELKVTPSHGQVFYIDSGVTPKVDASYAGYVVSNIKTAERKNLWVTLTDFATTSKVVLASQDDEYQQLDTIAASNAASGTTKTAFFLLKALGATTAPQRHIVRVYSGRPDLASSTELLACYFEFKKIAETIKAKANKVNSISSVAAPVSPELGGTVTVTVRGQTGTIGQGSTPDNDIVWLSPAAVSSWPTRALRLETTSLQFYNNNSYQNNQKIGVLFTDQLLVSSAAATYNASYYEAVYTFRIIGAAAATKAYPIAQISSGTQVKHSAIDGLTNNTIDLSTVTRANITVAKTASTTVVYDSATQKATISYTVTITTTVSSTLKLDEIVDVPSSSVTFKTGTAKITDTTRTNVAISDPSLSDAEIGQSPRPLHYIGPFTLSSSTSLVLTYDMSVPCSSTSGSYQNQAYAYAGDQKLGSTTSTVPQVTVTTSTNAAGTVCTASKKEGTASMDPSVETQKESSVTDTTATLNGKVLPAGSTMAVRFEYGTVSDLSSGTSLTPVQSGKTADELVAANITGLTGNTRYYFRATATWSRADGTTGTATGDIFNFTTAPTVYNATPSPYTDPASAIGEKTAILNGRVNPNQQAITKVEFLYSTSQSTVDSGSGTAVTVTNDDGSNFSIAAGTGVEIPVQYSFASNALNAGTTYYFRIRVTCTSNGSYCATPFTYSGSTRSFTTGSATVETLEATSVTATTATLNGNAATFDQNINVSFSYCSSPCSASALTSPTTTSNQLKTHPFSGAVSVNLTGLTPNTTYYFYVSAVTVTSNVTSVGLIVPFTTKQSQTITFPTINTQNYFGTNVTVTPGATSTSGLTVTYTSSTSSVCGISSGKIVIYALGTCTITAAQAGNSSYDAATSVTQSFLVTFPITVTADAVSKYVGSSDPSLTYTTTCNGSTPCTLLSGDSFTGSLTRTSGETAGTYAISQGSLALPTGYVITYVSANLTILAKLTQTISFTAIDDQGYYGASFTIAATATATSGLTVSFGTNSASVCTVSGSTITVIGLGTCSITASQAGDSTYAAATSVTRTFLVSTLYSIRTDAASSVRDTTGTLNGTITPGGTTMSYRFEYKRGSNDFSSGTTLTTLVTGKTATESVSFALTGLAVSSTYYYRIIATWTKAGSPGGSLVGDIVSFETSAPNDAASVETNAATSVTSTGAVLNGTVTTYGANATITFKYCKASADCTSSTLTNPTIVTVGTVTDPFTGAQSTTLTGLDPGSTYYFQISSLTTSNLTSTGLIRSFTTSKLTQTITFNSLADKNYFGTQIDFSISATASSGLTVSFSTTSTACSVSGTTVSVNGLGTCTITADQAGNSTYLAASSVSQTFTITFPITVTAVAVSKNPGTYDPSLTYTTTCNGQTPCTLLPGHSFTGALTRDSGESPSTTYRIRIGSLALPTGYVITFNEADLTINAKLSQTITFNALADKNYFGTQIDFSISATASSGLTVSFATSSSACSVSGTTVSVTGLGTCTITANQSGDDTYSAASSVSQSFDITFPITVRADNKTKIIGTSDPEFTYQYDRTLLTGHSFSGSLTRVSGTSVGDYAIQQGTLSLPSGYVITFIEGTLSIINKYSQVIDFTALDDEHYFGSTRSVTATATATSGLTVSFSSSTSDVCTVSGTTISIKGLGTCTITANQSGDSTYEAASSVSRSFAVTFPITVTAVAVSKNPGTSDPSLTYTTTCNSQTPCTLLTGHAFTGSLTRDSGESPSTTYRIRIGSLALPAGYVITFNEADLTINAKLDQTITFTGPSDKTYFGTTVSVSVSATATSGLTVSFSSSTSSVCTVSGTTVSVVGLGTCTITADQGGNSTYNAASAVSQSFTVTFPITVSADALSKTVGTDDPPLTYSTTCNGTSPCTLLGSDGFSGALSRASGQTVGTYAIGKNTLALPSGYVITFVPANFTITDKLTQTITFTAISNKNYFGSTVTFSASASATSGLTVSFTGGTPGVCTIDGTTVTLVGLGSCSITANQSGSALYEAAASVTRSFLVTFPITVTAAAKTKSAGAVDPALTYSTTCDGVSPCVLLGTDAFTGALSRASGEFAGTYAISQNTLALPSGYVITYVPANLTIEGKLPQTITFGSLADRNYFGTTVTFSVSATASSGLTVTFSSLTSSICTVSGTTVSIVGLGTCTIAADQAGDTNYDVASRVSRSFAATFPITVTADALSKTLGASDPVLTYSTSCNGTNPCRLLTGDAFTGTLSRASGETAGTYAITQNTLALPSGYVITFVPANFTISSRASQTITFAAISNQNYFGTTVTLTATASATSGLTVTLVSTTPSVCTVSGRTVSITSLGTCSLTASQGGNATYEAAASVTRSFAVTFPVTVTAVDVSKIVGQNDPVLAYDVSRSLLPGDVFTGALERIPGETVGTYLITQGSLGLRSGYVITYVAGVLTISSRLAQTITFPAIPAQNFFGSTVVVTPNATASSGLPVTYSVGPSTVCRLVGRTVEIVGLGTCSITASQPGDATYAAAAPVTVTFSVIFPVTVTAENKTKTLGQADPVLTYTVSRSLLSGDSFSGALTRVPGESVGTYSIMQGTLTLRTGYVMTFVPGVLTISSLTSQTITFPPIPTQNFFGSTVVVTPNATASSGLPVTYSVGPAAVCRLVGNVVEVIGLGTCSITASQGGNASFAPAVPVTVTFNVVFPVTVTAENKTKMQGERDPVLTYLVSRSLLTGDAFTGALTRVNGESAGTYAITQGSLALRTGYVITFIPAVLTITSKATIRVDGIVIQEKTYDGTTSATVDYSRVSITGIKPGDDVKVELPKVVEFPKPDVGNYVIRIPATLSGSKADSYLLEVVDPVGSITPRMVTLRVASAKKTEGEPDPDVRYTIENALPSEPPVIGSLIVVRQPGESAGRYDLMVATPAGQFSNYTVQVVPGTLEIVPDKPVIEKVTYAPLSISQTKVQWSTPSISVERFEVTRNGTLICATTATSCVVPIFMGPKSTVEVTVIEKDGDSAKARGSVYIEKLLDLMNVYFASDKSVITTSARKRLVEVGNLLEREGYNNFVIDGNTDSQWTEKYNKKLSRDRAIVVKNFLEKYIDDFNVKLGYFGFSQPIASNETAQGRALNRRTTLRLAQPLP